LQTYPDLVIALEAAATAAQNLIVLCGSLYLVGHFGVKRGYAAVSSSDEGQAMWLDEALCVWAGKDYFSGVSFVWL